MTVIATTLILIGLAIVMLAESFLLLGACGGLAVGIGGRMLFACHPWHRER